MVRIRPRIVNVQADGDEVIPTQTPPPLRNFIQGQENERSSSHTDYIEEDLMTDMPPEDEEPSQSVTTKRRGPTMMAHIWNLPKNKRMPVNWNTCWQPVGGERSNLAHFIGTMARNPALCSLSYPPDWRLVPKEKKNELLQIVKSKFIIPNAKAAKYVLQSMGRKWSNFKAELKNDFYEPNRGNVSKVLNAKPGSIPPDQWISLVTYWSSSKGKERSVRNRMSRGCQVIAHTAGSKSFACVIEEQVSEFVNDKLNDMPNNKEVTNGIIAWEGDIYSQVMNEIIGPERRGRVRGLGKGPSSLPSTSCDTTEEGLVGDHTLCNEKIKVLECELEKVNDKWAKIQDENLETQRKIQEELTMLKVALFGRDILNHNTT